MPDEPDGGGSGLGDAGGGSDSDGDMDGAGAWHNEQYGNRWRAYQQEQSEAVRREAAREAEAAERRRLAKPPAHGSSAADSGRSRMEAHVREWERFASSAKERPVRFGDVPWPALDAASLGLDSRYSSASRARLPPPLPSTPCSAFVPTLEHHCLCARAPQLTRATLRAQALQIAASRTAQRASAGTPINSPRALARSSSPRSAMPCSSG